MPTSPRGVCRLSGWKRRTRPYRRPLQIQRALSALGAMPSSPRGVCRLSGWKRRTRPYRRLPGRCGHRPLQNLIIVFLLCNPMRFFFLNSSFISCGDLRATPSTSASEAFLLSTTSDFVCTGGCPHSPAMEFDELSRKTNKFSPLPPGPIWASALW